MHRVMPRHACGTSRPRPHRPSPVQKAVPRRPWCRVPTGTKRSSAALDEVPPPRYRPTRPSGRGTRWAMKSASGQYRHVRPSRHGTPLTGAGETRENRASGAPLTGAGETRENTVNRASVKNGRKIRFAYGIYSTCHRFRHTICVARAHIYSLSERC